MLAVRKEDIDDILMPFGQVANVMTRQHEGTGLGLPITKSLTELNGGVFHFESKFGVGTTVTIVFPGYQSQ